MKVIRTLFLVVVGGFLSLCTILLCGVVITLCAVLFRGFGDEDSAPLAVKTDRAVGVVELKGEILTSEKFDKSLKRLVDNEKIKAVVVRIDSPGGAVGASEEMYQAIREADQRKPVICSLGSVAASGGLMAALGCRKIIANESTLTGSIGVIMMSPMVKRLLNTVGVEMQVFKSGKFKDSGSPFREANDEDRELIQNLINASYEQFVALVANSRQLDVAKVKSFADGRIILGQQAKELGLIDDIGTLTKAAKVALTEAAPAEKGDPEIVLPKKAGGPWGMLVDQSESLADWVTHLRSLSRTQLLSLSFF